MYTMSPWKYSNSCHYESDRDEGRAEEYSGDLSGSTSDGSDSEEQLREVEELLYSQIHFAPNTLFPTDGNFTFEVEDIVPGAVCPEGTTGNFTAKKPIADDGFHGEAVSETKDCCKNVTGTRIDVIDLRSSDSDETPVVAKPSKKSGLKRNKVATTKIKGDVPSVSEKQFGVSSQIPIVLDQTSDSDLPIDKPADQLNESNISGKKKVKTKQITSTPSNTKLAVHKKFVSESDMEISSDAFCHDKSSSSSSSSMDLSSAEDDDIKVHQVQTNRLQDHSEHLLKDVLDSLPDCSWDIDTQDRCVSSASRYYQTSQSRSRCANCFERGHVARVCPMPLRVIACLLCGTRGHVSRGCPDALCLNCHQPGHSLHSCGIRRQLSEFCRRCGMKGHASTGCPDAWRQYHLTTGTGRLVKSVRRRTTLKFCYNCAARGHFGHECREERADVFIRPNIPFVAKYDDDQFETSVDDRTQEGNTSRHSGYNNHQCYRSPEKNRSSNTSGYHNAKNRATNSYVEHSFHTKTYGSGHKNKPFKSDVERLHLSETDSPSGDRIKSHNRYPSPVFERGHRKKDKARTGSQSISGHENKSFKSDIEQLHLSETDSPSGDWIKSHNRNPSPDFERGHRKKKNKARTDSQNKRQSCSSQFNVKSQPGTGGDTSSDVTVQKHKHDGNVKVKTQKHNSSGDHRASRRDVGTPKEDGDRQKTEVITNGGPSLSRKRKHGEAASKSDTSRSPSPWIATPRRPNPSCDRQPEHRTSPERDIHLKTETPQSSSPAATPNGREKGQMYRKLQNILQRSKQKEKRKNNAIERRKNEESTKIEDSAALPIAVHSNTAENFDEHSQHSTGDAKRSKRKTTKTKMATKEKQIQEDEGELRVSSSQQPGARTVVKTERGFRMTIDASKL